jgi:hypothetical protein
MEKRGQMPVREILIVIVLILVLVLAALFVPKLRVMQEKAVSCPGVWKAACSEFDAGKGTEFLDYELNPGMVCCIEKNCPGVWRDVVVCTSSAQGTSMGRGFSDAGLRANNGKVCCSK